MFEKNETKEEKTTVKKKNVPKKVAGYTHISVTTECRKKLNGILSKVNKKDKGRMIRPYEVLMVALDRLTEQDIKDFQEKSIRGFDKFSDLMDKFLKKNGKSSKDDFYKFVSENVDLGLA